MLLFIYGYNYIILRLAKFLLYYNSICKIFEMKDGGCILHECKKVTIATPVIVLILNLKNIETLSRVFFFQKRIHWWKIVQMFCRGFFLSLLGLICRGEGVLCGSFCSGFLFKTRKLHHSQEGVVTKTPHEPPNLSELPPRILYCTCNSANHGMTIPWSLPPFLLLYFQ